MLSGKMAGLENHYEKKRLRSSIFMTFHTQAADPPPVYLPVEALAHIKEFILELGRHSRRVSTRGAGRPYGSIKTCKVMPSALLSENIIIGKDTEVRFHCAFLREMP